MSILTLLAVDDEPAALNRLKSLLAETPGVTLIGALSDSREALARINRERPDVLILDISMPGLNGLELIANLAKGYAPAVIYVTAFQSFAVDAFERAAVDYLVKPASSERLRMALDRARERLNNATAAQRLKALETLGGSLPAESLREQHIWVPVRGGRTRVSIADVRWIEAEREYARIHAGPDTGLVRASMTSLEARFGSERMVRVHRSAMVNLDHVRRSHTTAWGGMALETSDGDMISVGPSYRSNIKRLLREPELRTPS
ncbi:response regulator transcription factor [Brevundimonas sp. 2R-24]|uniref:Response regulator transcription factor n=1 Tax=Peiella sedimenti TaxID=3061083 RepID=A0ABT8SM72_9CAUL|nr:response regulator transcription factor [Caulobacteraceae bacterium XZ-24]